MVGSPHDGTGIAELEITILENRPVDDLVNIELADTHDVGR